MEEPTREQATGWFDVLYKGASRDPRAIPWADLRPSTELVAWLDRHPQQGPALVVACGLGDDAEELARRGHRVAAFDAAPEAIAWCRERFPGSAVDYRVEDLFDLPADWRGAFDVVVENRTIQSLPLGLRDEVIAAIAATVSPGGSLFLVAFSRPDGTVPSGPPWPVARAELAALAAIGLAEISLDEGGGRFVGWYRRPDREAPAAAG